MKHPAFASVAQLVVVVDDAGGECGRDEVVWFNLADDEGVDVHTHPVFAGDDKGVGLHPENGVRVVVVDHGIE